MQVTVELNQPQRSDLEQAIIDYFVERGGHTVSRISTEGAALPDGVCLPRCTVVPADLIKLVMLYIDPNPVPIAALRVVNPNPDQKARATRELKANAELHAGRAHIRWEVRYDDGEVLNRFGDDFGLDPMNGAPIGYAKHAKAQVWRQVISNGEPEEQFILAEMLTHDFSYKPDLTTNLDRYNDAIRARDARAKLPRGSIEGGGYDS